MGSKERQFSPDLSGVIPRCIENGWFYITEFGIPAVTFELTTWNGYKSMRMVVESEFFTDEQEYVYTGAASDESVPARMAMQSPGFSFQLYTNYKVGLFPATWIEAKTAWMDGILGVLVAAIEYFTNGTVGEDPGFWEISSAAGHFNQRVVAIPIFTDTEVLVLQCGLYGLDNFDNQNQQILVGAPIPSPMYGSQQGGFSKELADIARALEAVAHTSRVTWINNEGGFAELISGDIVTP